VKLKNQNVTLASALGGLFTVNARQ